MKKIFFAILTTAFLFSCGGSSNSNSNSDTAGSESKETTKDALIASDFDYKMLGDEAQVKKIMDGVIAKAGDNISKLDKIDIWISRPSKEGPVKLNKPDFSTIILTHLDPNDAKKLFEVRYNSEKGEWNKGESKSIRLVTGNAETFVLANEMYDASALTSDMVAKAVKDALAKYGDANKYSDQWVKGIIIEKGKIEVSIRGILAANDLEKTEYYKTKIGK